MKAHIIGQIVIKLLSVHRKMFIVMKCENFHLFHKCCLLSWEVFKTCEMWTIISNFANRYGSNEKASEAYTQKATKDDNSSISRNDNPM